MSATVPLAGEFLLYAWNITFEAARCMGKILKGWCDYRRQCR